MIKTVRITKKSGHVLNDQSGLAMLDYVIALSIMLGIFVLLGIVLGKGAISRGEKAEKAVNNPVPFDDTVGSSSNILNNDEKY